MVEKITKEDFASFVLDDEDHPKRYGIKHKEWRTGQLDAVKFALDGVGTKVLGAPTGSGKTTVATAMGSDGRITALCGTKILQETVYKEYGYAVLKGKSNYICRSPIVARGSTAEDCPSREKGIGACARGCEYPPAKMKALGSNKVSLNYALFLTSKIWSKEPPQTLVLDEAHTLSDVVLSRAGTSIHEKIRKKWNLPPFPKLRSGGILSSNTTNPSDVVIGWLDKCIDVLSETHRELKTKAKFDDVAKKELRKCEMFGRKIRATLGALHQSDEDWYIKSGRNLIYYRGENLPGVIAKPLTARHHFEKYFLVSPRTLLMSATIGHAQTFADELGLGDLDDGFQYHSQTNNWMPEQRPVYLLDAPRMGKGSGEKEYNKQADVIASAINDCPGDWSGIIHVTRITESELLKQRLMRRGIPAKRLWLPPKNAGTDAQVKAWQEYKMFNPNAIAITYSWYEGVDLGDERICILTKTPFFSLGDPFELARMKFDKNFYSQRTAWKLEQGLGRTRRGRVGDYDTPFERNGLVAIADGNWTRVKKYLSEDLKDAIVKHG